MNDILQLLQRFLPAEIAVIAVVFIYVLLLFKGIAEKFISIAEKQATLAEKQVAYIQQRLDVLEKTIGISEKSMGVSDKAFDLQEKQIKKLVELADERETEITRSRKALDDAREQLRIMEQRYQDAIATLNLQTTQAEELQAAQRRLERASREEIMARILHELQTLLQSVLANAEILMLDSRSLDSREIHVRIREVFNATLALGTVLQNLEWDMEEYHFEKQRIDILLHEARQVYEAEAKRKGIDILIDLAPVQDSPPILEISREHLQIAFNNLIHNAIKYSFRARSGIPHSVRVGGLPAGEYYAISIENYGVGILPEEIESGMIFEVGYQGELTVGEYRTGIGIGLHNVKRIIACHHGSIEVSSKLMDDQERLEGHTYLTQFVVYLPYVQPVED